MVEAVPSELMVGPELMTATEERVSAAEALNAIGSDPFISGDAVTAAKTPEDDTAERTSAGAAVAPRQETSAVLKLKGLPYSTTEEAILEFFSGFSVLKISFVYEPDGRPSGLAFAEFDSKEEALKALSKNGEYIGERYVRLLHVPKTEMDEQVRLGTLAIPGAAAKLRSRLMRAQQRSNVTYLGGPLQLAPPIMSPGGRPLMGPNAGSFSGGQLPIDARGWPGGFPPGQYAGGRQYAQQPGQYLGQNYTGGQGAPGGYPGPGQGPPGAFQGQQQPGVLGGYPGQQGQQQGLPGGYPQGGPGAYPGQQGGPSGYQPLPATLAAQFGALSIGAGGNSQAGVPRNGSGGFAQGALGPAGNLHTPSAQILNSARAAQQAPSSATLKIRGLPYRSSPAEILTFFSSYHFLPDSLQIGLDSLARPSGEAWLTFVNPQEALRAVRDLNRHYLGNRYLELSLC